MTRWPVLLLMLWSAGCTFSELGMGDASSTSSPGAPDDVVAFFEGRAILRADIEPDPGETDAAREQLDEAELAEWLAQAPALELRKVVFGGLLDRYREAEKIEPTRQEIDGFIAFVLAADDSLDPNEDEARREADAFARSVVLGWKTNRGLYERYGGRVIFQQAGPEPLDAYRAFLEERRAAGQFEIRDDLLSEDFWRYFVDENMHTFYNAEDADEAFRTPWWLSGREPAGDPP